MEKNSGGQTSEDSFIRLGLYSHYSGNKTVEVTGTGRLPGRVTKVVYYNFEGKSYFSPLAKFKELLIIKGKGTPRYSFVG